MDSLRQLIKQMIGKQLPLTISSGKVDSVDGDTCTVKREGLVDLTDVRLNAIEGAKNYLRIIPKVGSDVLVGLIENKKEHSVILSCSDVEKIELKYDNGTTMDITEQDIVINGGQLGGLTITPKLVDELNKNNDLLNAILNVITGAPIMEPGSGSPSALQASLSGAVAGKPVGDFSQIEDTKVKH